MSFTPEQTRKTWLGVTPSPAPFLTPRPERRRTDPRVMDGTSNRQDRDREVNVQVLVRCRPLSDEEQRLNIPKVISCNEQRREVTVLQNIANKHIDRAFTFDKVFGPKSQQRSIYDHAISPIVNEVLEGFNCTVFAYGQTGTGKTYTMEGGTKTKGGGELSADAGVIPRAVRQIFDTLEAQNADYSMKVTFLELYNEEITDLLAVEDNTRSIEDKQKKPISLMEDGKGVVFVRGLEEEVVYSANEIYNLLERGSAKRRTADTLLNKHSSRSHSVFSITIHVKETTIGDEELVKCGKLNLVDLAGSENICRSGAREGRAREAGEINKSLLTLGRVINALVEHSGHIPYRDSKLTRLLRDSLGGKTKTCIIATVSPSPHCLEETLSTLDYAYRAKHIKNKPEANQKMSRTVLLKDLYLEIERMKEDVRAARDKNGVYIPHERFAQDEAEKKAMNEKIEQLEIDLEERGKQADTYRDLYANEQEQKLDVEHDLKECKANLEKSMKDFEDLQEQHRRAVSTLKEKEFIISNLLRSENSIIGRAKELRANLQHASEDITTLCAKIDQKNNMETENHGLILTFGSHLDQRLKNLHKTIVGCTSQQQQHLRCMEENIGSFIASKCDATKVLESRIEKIKDTYTSGVGIMKELATTLQNKASTDLEQIKSTVSSQTMAAEKYLFTAVLEAGEVISEIKSSIDAQKQLVSSSAQQLDEGLKRSLASAKLVSNATFGFFDDLHQHVSKLMAILEETHMEKSNQLASFQKKFEEESARDKKVALERIALILTSLISNKNAMVSEALKSMDEKSTEEQQKLEQEVLNMQQVSADAKQKWNEYIEKVQSNFLEDTFSAAETKVKMESILLECTNRVDDSGKQWENVQLSIDQLNKRSFLEIESTVKKEIHSNRIALEEFVSASSSIDAKFNVGASDLLASVKDSLLLDHEAKKGIESVSNLCMGQLRSVQDIHNESISNLRNRTEQCLRKEYLVDSNRILKKPSIEVPTLASIEALRTPALEDLTENMKSMNRSKGISPDGKVNPCTDNRTPFAAVN